jgi:hypothetical protein
MDSSKKTALAAALATGMITLAGTATAFAADPSDSRSWRPTGSSAPLQRLVRLQRIERHQRAIVRLQRAIIVRQERAVLQRKI